MLADLITKLLLVAVSFAAGWWLHAERGARLSQAATAVQKEQSEKAFLSAISDMTATQFAIKGALSVQQKNISNLASCVYSDGLIELRNAQIEAYNSAGTAKNKLRD